MSKEKKDGKKEEKWKTAHEGAVEILREASSHDIVKLYAEKKVKVPLKGIPSLRKELVVLLEGIEKAYGHTNTALGKLAVKALANLEQQEKEELEKKKEEKKKLKLSAIQIFVSDIRKAEKWYTEVLGMKLIEEYPETKCLLMKLGDTKFYVETPCQEWGEGWATVQIGGRTPIIFETKDIEKTVKELKQKGVKFVEEISKRSWGEYKAVFADPDGNEHNLIQSE